MALGHRGALAMGNLQIGPLWLVLKSGVGTFLEDREGFGDLTPLCHLMCADSERRGGII